MGVRGQVERAQMDEKVRKEVYLNEYMVEYVNLLH